MLTTLKAKGSIYDGLTFSPHSTLGLSSPVVHITDEAEVLYTCGNYYCMWA